VSPGRPAAIAALALAAGVIGFMPILVRWSDAGPVATAFWRLALAAVVLIAMDSKGFLALAQARDRRLGWLAIAGALFGADIALFGLALGRTSVANASVLNNLSPLFAGLIALVLWRPPSRSFWAGLAIAIGGVVMLFAEEMDSKVGIAGLAYGLLSAACFAGYLLLVARVRGELPTGQVLAWTTTFAALALVPVPWMLGEATAPTSSMGWVSVAALAVLVHCGGQALMVFALSRAGGAEAGLIMMLQPVAAALLGWLLLGESLTTLSAAGGLVVLAGLCTAILRADARQGSSSRAGTSAPENT